MITLSVTLVKVASQANISGQLIKDIVFLLAQLVHIFFFLLQGQFVLNANDEFAESIYNTFWYNTNTRTKLLLVLVLRSCSSAPNLSAGGLLVFNLKNFSEVNISGIPLDVFGITTASTKYVMSALCAQHATEGKPLLRTHYRRDYSRN
nr:uncharacterized protein LOC117159885 [Bombus vancouverensis nearcticus]